MESHQSCDGHSGQLTESNFPKTLATLQGCSGGELLATCVNCSE